MDFAQKLISWYLPNKRDLPWRNTNDPYKIWLSEIILQQTRVEQGLPYYLKLLESFPTVKDLANAPIDKVLKLWQGLGYYSRARNLHFAAQTVCSNYNGHFPESYDELKKLKGIGDYTAAAIASFSFNKAHAVVDGNVYRVISRYFDIETPIDSSAGKTLFNALANELIDKKNPAIYNQAIMEFGATYCKPQSPDCTRCIFSETCLANRNKKVAQLPVKEKSTKVKERYFYYFILKHREKIFLKKRTAKDIWQGLYEFPLVEMPQKAKIDKVLKSDEFINIFSGTYILKSVSETYKHILSHQHIYASFIELEITQSKNSSIVFEKSKKEKLHQYAIPRLIERYLKEKNYFTD